MNSPYIYLRGLKNVDHSVFAVEEGQKFYFDPQFRRPQPFSSGQQVKRSILEEAMNQLGQDVAPINFLKKQESKNSAPNDVIAEQPCDPSYPDQLIGGYMKASSNKIKREESESSVVKRRSPLSISALRPLHPLLARMNQEGGVFDRRGKSNSKVTLFGPDGKEMSSEEMKQEIENIDKQLPKLQFLDNQDRASGLFIYDVAIDLRRLFTVSIADQYHGESEVYESVKNKLKENGWQESENFFGPCLVCPRETREKIINALAESLVDWRITSNQARTFSMMEPLAYAISDKAYKVAASIRGDLREDTETDQAIPRIDASAGAEIFKTPSISAYVKGEYGNASAVEEAKNRLIEQMQAFDYENQTVSATN